MSQPSQPPYQPPRDYLAAGLFTPGTREVRPDLLAEHAAATARALILDGVMPEAVGECLAAVEPAARLPDGWRSARERLITLAGRPSPVQAPLLAQLLRELAGALRGPDELPAALAHLRRVHVLAHFSRTLGAATIGEQERRGDR